MKSANWPNGWISPSDCSPKGATPSVSVREHEPMNGPDAALAFFILGGGFWVVRPLAAAIAKRIAGEHRPAPQDPQEREAVLEELQQLRQEVTELQERMDFAERLLAKQRDVERLAPPHQLWEVVSRSSFRLR